MSEKIILVLASRDDVHADAVISVLHEREQEVVRIDPTDYWLENSKFIWNIDSVRSQSVLNWNGKVINGDKVGAVFNRKFGFSKPEGNSEIATLLKYAEARAALFGFFRSLENVYWMNPPWNDEMADNKPYQYACAINVGLRVPRTLVSNDPKEFLKFYKACNKEVIIKQLSEVCLIEEVEYPSKYSTDTEQTAYGFYTNKIDAGHLENIDEIINSPCLFQEHILKKGDVRVTVVEEDCFSTLIDSQSSDKSIVDFRLEPFLPLKNYTLPDDTKENLLCLLKKWGIKFAACDFALTPSNELVFLEVNVVGNWLWLEKGAYSAIGESIATALSSAF